MRSFDGYAMPVQFTYKGDAEFTTSTGGVITILTSLLLFFYAGQQIIFLLIQPDFTETVTTSYADFTTNEEMIELDTKHTTFAMKL